MKKITYLIAVLLPIVFASITFASAFQNGSFEIGTAPAGSFQTLYGGDSTSITGWTVTGSPTANSIDYIGSLWTASDGVRSLDLNGFYQQGGITQTFDTVANQDYAVSFDLSGNFYNPPDPKTMSVAVALYSGSYSFSMPVSWSFTNMGWTTYSFQFTAQNNSSTLTFNSTTDSSSAFGPALDNVRVSDVLGNHQVPEPSIMLLLGSGLVGLAGFGKRRFKK